MDLAADRDSESDSSSLDGAGFVSMMPPSPVTRDQLQKRIESLQQQNRVLKVELDTYKLRVKSLQEENRSLRHASVIIQAKAEQEEEYISNTLMKKIQALKKEKETLVHHYEQEEECLTNDLSRKMLQLRQEKCKLEQTLEQEQECLVNRLMRKIEKLEAETLAKQSTLEQLRREKVELENTLEQEQEALVNRLWKRMDKLEEEKRMLKVKLDQPVSNPSSPRSEVGAASVALKADDAASHISSHIQVLRSEVSRLRSQLDNAQKESSKKMEKYAKEERHIREENVRLRKKLQEEVERKETLCSRHLSESESSLEFDEERCHHFHQQQQPMDVSSSSGRMLHRATSSPSSPFASRPISPPTPAAPTLAVHSGGTLPAYCFSSSGKCCTCGQVIPTVVHSHVSSPSASPAPLISGLHQGPQLTITVSEADNAMQTVQNEHVDDTSTNAQSRSTADIAM